MEAKLRDNADPSPRRRGSRHWLAATGAALIVACLVPPIGVLARQYLFVESIQFCVFAMVGPALIVLGAPWRILRLSSGEARLVDRLAGARRRRPQIIWALGYLIAWVVICLFWRLLPILDALARHPALVAAETITLCAAGIGLWLELVPSLPLEPRLTRAQRGLIATLAMWSIWVAAYLLGFAGHPVAPAYDPPGSHLAPVDDQEITAFVMWAAAAASFIPVIAVALLAWVKDDAAPTEPAGATLNPRVRGWGRPARDSRAAPPRMKDASTAAGAAPGAAPDPILASGSQPGRPGGATSADSDLLAVSIMPSIVARSASSTR
jgi:cytochrome c oxidase assembly factor CtaG